MHVDLQLAIKSGNWDAAAAMSVLNTQSTLDSTACDAHLLCHRPPASRWIYSRSRINKEMLQKHLAPAGADVLTACCGPEGMILQACLPNLLALGYSKEQIVVF